MTRLGLVTGLALECRLAERAVPALFPQNQISAIPVAGQAEAARDAVRRLAERGAEIIVSFGFAGGLAPDLPAGTLLLPKTLRCAGRDDISVDHQAEMAEGAVGLLVGATPLSRGALLTVEAPVATVADKQQAQKRFEAVAVDMESYWVAEACCRAGLGFLALRAVSDPAQRALPASAARAMGPDGNLQIGRLLGGLLSRPGDIPELVRLGLDSRKASAALGRAAALLLPLLGRR